MSALKEKMKMDMELRGFSPNTVKAYLTQVRNYAQYYNSSPELLGEKEIRGYLYYCSTEKHFSESHLNIIYSSLKFLYLKTLKREWNIDAIPRRKRIEKLPIILSREEISALFSVTTNLKHKAILMTIYGGGLRVSEASALKIIDIDSKNMQILIQQGKGKKDRYTLLSKQNLSVLRDYYRQYSPSTWLFCGATGDKPITERSIQRVFQEAKAKVGIKRNVSVHTLRHCFATHLLEQGTDLCYIQELMGHSSIGTNVKIRRMNEVQDIFRIHGEEYRKRHRLPLNQLKAMIAIETCRTAELGGHKKECPECGYTDISFNSCRNRHCPKCQSINKEKWLEARKDDLLPVGYFHVVFTIPKEIEPIAIRNQKLVYDILLKTSSNV